MLKAMLPVIAKLNSAAEADRLATRWLGWVSEFPVPLTIDDDKVLFLYWAGDPSIPVYIAGDWTGWRPEVRMKRVGQSRLFSAVVKLSSDTFVGYKFVVDNQWYFDDLNPARVGAGPGSFNSLLRMPGFEEPALVGHQGGLLKGTLVDWGLVQGAGLKGGRRVRIYTPPSYTPEQEGLLPTLYIQDGDENLSRGNLPDVFDALDQLSELPLCAVFIDHPGAERHLDYTPFFGGSRLDRYSAFVAETVLPKVESRFRVSPSPKERVIMGHSFGATCSLGLSSHYSELFPNIGAQSGVYVWEGNEKLLKRAGENLNSSARVYVDSTRFGMEPYQGAALLCCLSQLGVDHIYKQRGTSHTYEGWRLWLPEMIEFLLRRGVSDLPKI